MNNTQVSGRLAFGLAGIGLAFGAAVHLAAYAAGPAWMAWLGVPPVVLASRAAGTWLAPAGTMLIAGLLLGLAALCRVPAQGRLHRAALAGIAGLFVLRGLLVLPYWAGLRDLRTPIGRFVILGDSFAAGSLLVLAIGLLMAAGLVATRRQPLTSSRADP